MSVDVNVFLQKRIALHTLKKYHEDLVTMRKESCQVLYSMIRYGVALISSTSSIKSPHITLINCSKSKELTLIGIISIINCSTSQKAQITQALTLCMTHTSHTSTN